MVQMKPPSELDSCSRDALQRFARSCIEEFNSQPELASTLGCSLAGLQTATARLLGSFLGEAEPARAVRRLRLQFVHDCKHISCADESCLLCQQSQYRRCTRTFARKYLSGDILKAACGASIKLQVVDDSTGKVLFDPNALLGYQIQLFILDGKVAEVVENPQDYSDLEGYMVLFNHQHHPLLVARQYSSRSDGFVLTPLASQSMILPDLFITGSSEALLKGQKPPLILAAQLLDGNGQRVGIPALSEGFVVATPRVRTASKNAILHCSDSVSKINAVGNATQFKLKDLRRAAEEAGLPGFVLPFRSISRVREFKALLEWAEEDSTRCDITKKVLKLTKGWEEARDHVFKAVESDARLRLWTMPNQEGIAGLLFPAEGAIPSLDRPLALVESLETLDGSPHSPDATQHLVRARLIGTDEGELSESDVRPHMAAAQAAWSRRGHPGWSVLPLDSKSFLPGCGHNSSVLLPGTIFGPAPAMGSGGSFLGVYQPPAEGWQGQAAAAGVPNSVHVPSPPSLAYELPPTSLQPESASREAFGVLQESPLSRPAPTHADLDRDQGYERTVRLQGTPGFRASRPVQSWAATAASQQQERDGERAKRARLDLQPEQLLDEEPAPADLDTVPGASFLSKFLSLSPGDPLRVDVPSLSRFLDNFISPQLDETGISGNETAPRVDYEAMLREAYQPYHAVEGAPPAGGAGASNPLPSPATGLDPTSESSHTVHTVHAVTPTSGTGQPLEATRSAIEQLLRVAEERAAVAASGTNAGSMDALQSARQSRLQGQQTSVGADLLRTLISGEFRIPDAELEKLVTIEPGLFQSISLDGTQWGRFLAVENGEPAGAATS